MKSLPSARSGLWVRQNLATLYGSLLSNSSGCGLSARLGGLECEEPIVRGKWLGCSGRGWRLRLFVGVVWWEEEWRKEWVWLWVLKHMSLYTES